MKCPRDGTQLAAVRIAGIVLDKCHRCDGIWCDRGEMKRLGDANLSGAEEILERKYGDPAFKQGSVGDYMRCPRCEDARLQGYSYTYTDGTHPVRIDRCERCFGIWLDKGELDAIIGEKQRFDDTVPAGRLRTFFASMAEKIKQ